MPPEAERTNPEPPPTSAQVWTWADILSTYRFWGLLLFFTLTLISSQYLFSSFVSYILTARQQLPHSHVGLIQSLYWGGALGGLLPAWAAVRMKTPRILALYSLLLAAGTALAILPADTLIGPSAATLTTALGALLVGIINGALLLTAPATLAQGRGGSEMLLIPLGTLTLFRTAAGMNSNALAFRLFSQATPLAALLLLTAPILLGLLFLIPVRPDLFRSRPPARGKAFPPSGRDPLTAGLLCLIPLYPLYWLYQIHGEIRSAGNDPRLLSPLAALLLSLFVPFLWPYILASLNDRCNTLRPDNRRSTGLIVLAGLLLYPLAAGLLQHRINTLIPPPDISQTSVQGSSPPLAKK